MPTDTRSFRKALPGLGIVLAAAAVLFAWTWQTWPDVLVDFGLQLYVPWRLAAGQVLYRDIALFTGPLSSYYNALAFWLFGTNLRVIEWANLPILLGIILLIYRLAWRMYGQLCATACGLAFVTLFAFARLTRIGNYNYVCPYEYECTHGLLLGLGCVAMLGRWLRGGRRRDAAAAGFLLGLAFLTRAEFFVPAAMACGLALAMSGRRRLGPNMAWMLSPAIVPPLIAVVLLSLAMPVKTALNGVLSNWEALFQSGIATQQFYRGLMGIDEPVRNFGRMAAWTGIYIAAGGIPFTAAMLAGRLRNWLVAALAVLLALGGAVIYFVPDQYVDWPSIFRPLPLVAVAGLAAALWRFWKSSPDARRQGDDGLAALFCVYSLVLLGKIILDARIWNYGCWLAMPATMVLVAIGFGTIPRLIRQRGGRDLIFVAAAGGTLWAVIAFHVTLTTVLTGEIAIPVGSGADRFIARTDKGIYVEHAVEAAERIIPPNATLACFPEGVMLNYLARRPSPVRYLNFSPPDILLWGEANMLADLRAHPPDYIFIVHKTDDGFGVHFFGRDYGREIARWIDENYRVVPVAEDLGAVPLRGDDFGIRLMVRRADLPATTAARR